MRDTFLKDCLVEGPAEAKKHRSSTRRKTLAAAMFLEAAIVFGLMLWPLLSSGSPPPKFVVLEHSLYPLQPIERVARRAQNILTRSTFRVPNFSPTRIVAQAVRPVRDEVPIIGDPSVGVSAGDTPFLGDAGVGSTSAALPKPKPPVVRVIRRSEGVQEGQLITRVTPVFPQIARAARIAGTVELMVIVGRDGNVLSVQVLSGSPLLAAAAKQAVEQWRYRPTILDGQAVEVESRVTVNFVLDE
ncbi:MAG TPA: energy transducer TonB [Candidatus Acidoferrales bacterium]|nr:energy transducer TonB [Candidatus Acidoferrales bacterium]